MFAGVPSVLGWAFWKYDTGNTVTGVAVSSGGDYIIAGTQNGGLFLLNEQGTQVWKKTFTFEVVEVSISGDGNRILAGVAEHLTGEPDVYLYDAGGNVVWKKDLIDSALPCAVSISQDGNYLAVADDSHKVRFFDGSGNQVWTKELADDVTSLSLTSTGDRLFASSLDNNIYCWDQTGAELWRYETQNDVDAVSVSPEGAYVASTGWRGLLFFDAEGHQLWNKTYLPTSDVSISTNGEYVVTSYEYNSQIDLLNKTGGEIWQWNVESNIKSVAITSNGQYVTAGTQGGFVYFIENLQPTSIACEVSQPRMNFGEDINIFGSISIPVEGATVTLTLNRPDDTTVTLDTTTTAGGAYSQTYTPSAMGPWSVQAYWAGDAQHMGAQSSWIPFDVGVSILTCDVENWQVYFGEDITVSGTIDPIRVEAEITLTYTDPEDAVFNRTVTLEGDGNYVDTITPSLAGMWNVEASWSGDANTLGASSGQVKFLVSTVQDVSIKIGRDQTFYTHFEPAGDYHHNPSFSSIVWDKNVTCPPNINFTTTEGTFEYHETFPGLGGTITSFDIGYNIAVLEGTLEGTYEVIAMYDISRQSKLWPYSSSFLFTYELRCTIHAVTKYETSIDLFPPLQLKLGDAANITGEIETTGGLSVPLVNVTLFYTRPDGTVLNRTAVTDYDGTFLVSYVPDMLGTWTVNASWNGDQDHNGTESLQVQFNVLTDDSYQVIWGTASNRIRVTSNSTVTDFAFNGTTKQIAFNVSGLPDTKGFCNVTIPKALLRGTPWTILLNDMDYTSSCTSTENTTCSFVYVPYSHSTNEIQMIGTWIIPEFPSPLILLSIMMATLAATLIYRRKHPK